MRGVRKTRGSECCAVKNADDELKRKADFVIKSNDEGGDARRLVQNISK